MMQNFIVDTNVSEEIKINLSKYGRVFFSKRIDNLYEPVNTHPDIQIHFFEKFCAVSCPETYEYYKSILPENINLIRGTNRVEGGYPNDAGYNVAVIGKNLICCVKHTSKEILDYYEKIGYNIINVNQGYTKCNICPVGNNAAITEDKGIEEALTKYGIDVCILEAGDIYLKNYKYGFIGGASGYLNKDLIGFFGNIQSHSQYKEIDLFLKKYNINYVSLSDDKLKDLGSIISF